MQDKKFTLRDTLLALKEYIIFLLRRSWLIILGIILGATLLFIYAQGSDVVRVSTLTFMINDEGGSKGGLNVILGQFGLVGAQDGSFNMPRALELFKSRKVIGEVLLEKIELNGHKDFIANHVLDIYGINEERYEGDDSRYVTIKNPLVDSMEIAERSTLFGLHEWVIGNQNGAGLLSLVFNDDTGIFTIKSFTLNDTLSLELALRALQQLSEFYVDNSLVQKEYSYNQIRIKRDSVELALDKVNARRALATDQTKSVLRSSEKLRLVRLQRESQILNIMYAETVKNLETSEFILKSSTPVFQIIDKPYFPVPIQQKGLLMYTVIGAILGLVLCVALLLLIKIVGDAISPTVLEKEAK
jgi:hypothetical protein